jgi:tetratricopeptide (TPR) repeat protein
VEFYRGRALEEADRATEAKAALDRFLAKRPADGEALLVRARALVKLGERGAAARDFGAALARLPRPNPEVYIERARVLAEDGRADEALRGLDEGIERLGPLVTLELPAVELELAAKRDDAALARVELLAAQSPRKEQWLARRGEILARAGRRAEAKEAFAAALAAIGSLKGSQRGVRATAELEARLRAALAEASNSPSGRQ